MSGGADPLPEPNPAAIRRHLDRLFRRCRVEYPDARCEIAWTAGAASWAVNAADNFPVTPEGLEKATATAVTRNREGRNVYVGINPRKPGIMPCARSDAADVEIAFFQFCECDKPESLGLLQRPPIPFSFAVVTGTTPNKRPHCYYELAEPVRDMALWRARQEALRDRFKGDAVVDPPRLMRLAGTVNYPAPHKAARGYQTELVTIHVPKRTAVTSEEFDRAYRITAGADGGAGSSSNNKEAETGNGPNFSSGTKDPRDYIRNIDAKNCLHNNALGLVAHLVGTGHRDWLIEDYLARLLRPVSDGGTLGKISDFIRTAREKWGTPDEAGDDDWDAPPERETFDIWDDGEDDAPIAPRGWLLGRFLCRQFLSSVLGDGAVGKTAFRIACALSLATGRNLTGEPVHQRCRVLFVCFEDGRDELRRRIRAAKMHHGISPSDTRGWLFLSALSRSDLKLAHIGSGGAIKKGRLGARIEDEVVARQIDVVILDPLVKTHSLPENSNEAVDCVAQILTDLAIKHDIAVDTPHHVRKGSAEPGNADAGRGGGAYKNAARLVYTLTKMSEQAAALFQISERERRQLVRLDSGKVNIAPDIDARWYRIVGVELGNATERYPLGDEVAVIECWPAPDLFDGIAIVTMNLILDEIDRGPSEGVRFSDSNSAKKRAAWRVVSKHTSTKNEEQCREIIRIWVDNEVILLEDYHDSDTRKNAKGLRVNPLKRPR